MRVLSPEFEAPRKRTRIVQPELTSRQCFDWMVITGNCHYARDRASFTTYRPVSQHIKSNVFNPDDECYVAGIGTVSLTVLRSPRDPTLPPHTLVLENVLHIPEAICNGFNPLLYGSGMSCNEDFWEGGDTTENPVWFSTPFAGGTRLVLADESNGESEMIPGKEYALCLYVSPEEWKAILDDGKGNAMEA